MRLYVPREAEEAQTQLPNVLLSQLLCRYTHMTGYKLLVMCSHPLPCVFTCLPLYKGEKPTWKTYKMDTPHHTQHMFYLSGSCLRIKVLNHRLVIGNAVLQLYHQAGLMHNENCKVKLQVSVQQTHSARYVPNLYKQLCSCAVLPLVEMHLKHF